MSEEVALEMTQGRSFKYMKTSAISLNLIGLLVSFYVLWLTLNVTHHDPSKSLTDFDRKPNTNQTNLSSSASRIPFGSTNSATIQGISSSYPSKKTSTSSVNEVTSSSTQLPFNDSYRDDEQYYEDEVLKNLPLKSIIFFSCVTASVSSLGLFAIIGHRVNLIFLYCLMITGSLILRLFGMMRWEHYSHPTDALADAFYVVMEVSLILLYFRLGCIIKLASDLNAIAQGRRRDGPNISQELMQITRQPSSLRVRQNQPSLLGKKCLLSDLSSLRKNDYRSSTQDDITTDQITDMDELDISFTSRVNSVVEMRGDDNSPSHPRTELEISDNRRSSRKNSIQPNVLPILEEQESTDDPPAELIQSRI